MNLYATAMQPMLISSFDYLLIILPTNWLNYPVYKITSDLSLNATVRLTFVVFSKMSQQLLDGLLENSVNTFM